MAKIHTVEWTPAVIAHPTTETGMHANWYGLLGERIRRRFGRIGPNDVLSGIPGSPTDHHGAPYSLTEEFVSVYRMHPLIPGRVRVPSLDGAAPLATDFAAIGPRSARASRRRSACRTPSTRSGPLTPARSSSTTIPRSLHDDFRPDKDGAPVDLATVDVLRDRERGVPRYNEFRSSDAPTPAASFEDLARDPGVARRAEGRLRRTSTGWT